METSLPKPFHKATIIPVGHPSWELRLEEPYRLTDSLTFEKVQGWLNPDLFSVWRDWISQRDRDNLSSIRFALMHYFDSSGHMGREEADSKDYGFNRKVLGPLRLEPTCGGHIDRPFYKATTSLNMLALVDPLIADEGPEGGSNSLQWWRRGESN